MPSSRAMRLISDVDRLSRIISRIRSVRSSSSWMAVRPRNPVPPHFETARGLHYSVSVPPTRRGLSAAHPACAGVG